MNVGIVILGSMFFMFGDRYSSPFYTVVADEAQISHFCERHSISIILCIELCRLQLRL